MLALGLSLLVLMLWSYLFPPPQPPQPATSSNKTTARTKQAQTTPLPAPVKKSFTPIANAKITGKPIIIDTPLYKAVFNSQGGIVEHFILKKYKVSVKPNSPNVDLISPEALAKGPLGIIWDKIPTWQVFNWSYQGPENIQLKDNQVQTITFQANYQNVTLTRKLTFQANTYQIKESLEISQNKPAEIDFVISTLPLSKHENRYNPTKIVYLDPEGLTEEHSEDTLKNGIITSNQVKWGGIANHYFILALIPETKHFAFKAKLEGKIYRLALAQNLNVPPQKQNLKCIYYLGPKEKKQLQLVQHDLVEAIHYGWFDFIAKPLISLLNFFYKFTHNYGIAIILLTVLIKLLFWPLSYQSYKSMNKMKKLQPLMAEIREKYKDDKQKMNEEMMRLYKVYKVNPASGCMPMLIQIPVFFGLYQGLLGAIELRHAPFIPYLPFTHILWLADLSAKDPLYITPLIMGATMFIQQKMTPAPGDPVQAKIMLFMPVIFTFLFLNFPSGLVIYWLVNNILSIAQQWWMLKQEQKDQITAK